MSLFRLLFASCLSFVLLPQDFHSKQLTMKSSRLFIYLFVCSCVCLFVCFQLLMNIQQWIKKFLREKQKTKTESGEGRITGKRELNRAPLHLEGRKSNETKPKERERDGRTIAMKGVFIRCIFARSIQGGDKGLQMRVDDSLCLRRNGRPGCTLRQVVANVRRVHNKRLRRLNCCRRSTVIHTKHKPVRVGATAPEFHQKCRWLVSACGKKGVKGQNCDVDESRNRSKRVLSIK